MKISRKKHLYGHIIILIISVVIATITEGGSAANIIGYAVGIWVIPGVIWIILAFIFQEKK